MKSLKPGDCLPSEPALARELGVSNMTLRKAVGVLLEEGLLDRRQGVGTFVRQARTWTWGLAFCSNRIRVKTGIFFRYIIGETQDWCGRQGVDLRLVLRDDQGDFQADGLDLIRRHAVDGMLMAYEVSQEKAVERLRQARIPHVGLMAHVDHPVFEHWVAGPSDMAPCIDALAQSGIARGALAGSGFNVNPSLRESAIRRATAIGLHLDADLLVFARGTDFDAVEEGRRVARAWLAEREPPTGVLFVDHFVCQGFQYEFLGRGIGRQGMPLMCVHEAREAMLDLPVPVVRVHFAVQPLIHQACQMLFALIEARPVERQGIGAARRAHGRVFRTPKPVSVKAVVLQK